MRKKNYLFIYFTSNIPSCYDSKIVFLIFSTQRGKTDCISFPLFFVAVLHLFTLKRRDSFPCQCRRPYSLLRMCSHSGTPAPLNDEGPTKETQTTAPVAQRAAAAPTWPRHVTS